ncbi:MAG: hypothetical protein IT340_02640 [Chloroflexi bacterium]|nr:hypothetical protein [Chloroflexota bacterium]
MEGDEVRLRPVSFTLETAAGSVPALAEPLTWEEIEARLDVGNASTPPRCSPILPSGVV